MDKRAFLSKNRRALPGHTALARASTNAAAPCVQSLCRNAYRHRAAPRGVELLYRRRAVHQPCFCLCFGFSQMTITRPLRLIILHFSHIGFTDGLTFTRIPPYIRVTGAQRARPALRGFSPAPRRPALSFSPCCARLSCRASDRRAKAPRSPCRPDRCV